MKYIVAIIQPHKLDEVMKTLEDVEVNLVTVSNVLGRGRQKGLTEVYRGAKEVGSLLKKIKLEIAVQRGFCGADDTGDHQGSPDGRDRRREDIRAGPLRGYPHPHGRARRQGHRIREGCEGL